MSGTPRIAVVVATFDRSDALARCLDALARQSLPAAEFEVVVVDDGGAPGLAARLRPLEERLQLRVIRQANQGPGVARNSGAAAARAPLVAFTDDDCLPAPDWLRTFVDRLDRDRTRLYGGRVVNALVANRCSVASQVILELAYRYHNHDLDDVRFLASNNMAVDADAFRRLGGFDRTFRVASEDRDLCARWREAGGRLAFVPEAMVAHAHPLTPLRFWRQHFAYGRGAWRYHRARRRRGTGRFARELSFHFRFVGQAAAELGRHPTGARLSIGALLALWQVANAAGFAREALGDVVGRDGYQPSR